MIFEEWPIDVLICLKLLLELGCFFRGHTILTATAHPKVTSQGIQYQALVKLSTNAYVFLMRGDTEPVPNRYRAGTEPVPRLQMHTFF